ncbi:MAG: zinc metallopeptidase [Verrucomicrobiota bacterium]
MIADPLYLIVAGLALIASRTAGFMLQKRFAEYSQSPIGLTGKQVAEKMLHENGIEDVEVISVAGQLTDHYNPAKKTVNLSDPVCHQANVAAAAVAAHECGHAVQHAKAYAPLTFRSAIVPVVSISSKFMQWVILAGVVMAASGSTTVLWIGVAMFAATTLFSIITLPVEFDASRRALKWLDQSNVVSGAQHEQAASALKWAASTYVVAALASIGQLLVFLRYLRR